MPEMGLQRVGHDSDRTAKVTDGLGGYFYCVPSN